MMDQELHNMMDQEADKRADAELERITSANYERFCAAERAACGTQKMPSWKAVGKRVRRRAQLRRVVNTMARFLPGLVFLAAIPQGWMTPSFACLMTLASFVWGLQYYMRGYRYE